LIIYEEGMKRISDDIFAPRSVVDVVRTMIAIEGREDLDRWCSKPSRRIKDLLLRIDTHTETENGKRYTFLCLKPWMKQALRLRRKLLKKPLSSPEAQIRWTNRVLSMLEREMELAKLLRWIDRDDFFFQIRVSGFRTQDENGDAEYLSDSIGTFNERSGAGAFREFAAKYGIMANELYARYLSDGY
jgi:hypothetical protein